ncbi:ABC transporter ATP-binding protein/permease [Allostreptomyces psammosilenae]|uniref:ABC-type transport system involved in cytochrome bd biosynthesis fused ATPase/permease subunit n=1 Tax=Allostreptomyces psammosilenae TaxID=1892865 RepID=A0A852ZSA2_9ACTN|nr:ATP-binding cassette domain-containing protein [Allostreptomyces psammosilenae]NYI04695.1 ABC-type transport system involved in cytochrome bd biosynthesis fused ATPase/permease subunit [Allostreptomyces psammosilenae]
MIHRGLLRLAGAVAWPIALSTAVALCLAAAGVGQAVALAHALTHLFRDAPGPAAGALVWASAFALLRAGLVWLAEVTRARCGIAVRVRLRDRLVGRLAELGPGHAAGERAGRIQATLVAGVEGLDAYYSRYLPQLLVVLLVPAGIVGWLFTVSVPAATVLAAAVAVAVVVPRFWDATLLRRGRDRWARLTRLSADYLEATQAIPTLRVLGAGRRTDERLAEQAARLHRSTMAQLRVSLVEGGISALAIHGGTAATLLVVGAGALSGTVPPTNAFLFLLCARECFRPLGDLSSAWHAGYLGLTAADDIDALLGAVPRVRDTGTHPAPDDPAPEVRFERVTFTHPGPPDRPAAPARPTLDRVSVRCPPGGMLGVVGASGAGKSTLAHLLLRHDDPDGGRILLAGRPLPEYRLDALRATVAVVHQDPYLFHGSVADNLRLARPEATDRELRHAAALAQAHAFLEALPDGYDTVIGERGSSLSGGQAQRLALARAFLSPARVLVLDEATSHLDAPTEQAVLRALRTELADRTRVVIAHRLHAVRDADVIAVVSDGRVVETGSHEELVRKPHGAYRALLRAQEGATTATDEEVPA